MFLNSLPFTFQVKHFQRERVYQVPALFALINGLLFKAYQQNQVLIIISLKGRVYIND
jgi:hypothetical protein